MSSFRTRTCWFKKNWRSTRGICFTTCPKPGKSDEKAPYISGHNNTSSVGGADCGVLCFVVDAVDISFDQVVQNPGLQRVVRVMPWQNISPV